MYEHLGRIPLFNRLTPSQMREVERVSRPRGFPAGYQIFFEGDPPDALHVIVGGAVKIFQQAEDGREMILAVRRAGEVVGEMALIDGKPRSASAAAVEPTETVSIDQVEFRKLALGSPELLWKLLEAMSERLRDAMDTQYELTFRSEAYRVIHALVKLGGDAKDAVTLAVTRKDLAGLAGVDAGRVDALLRRIAGRGLAALEGEAVRIPSVPALRSALTYADTL